MITYSNRSSKSAQQSAMMTSTTIKGKTVETYYSFQTVVAVRSGGKLAIMKNIYSRKTGEHLNLINDDKSIRLDRAEFITQAKALGVEVS